LIRIVTRALLLAALAAGLLAAAPAHARREPPKPSLAQARGDAYAAALSARVAELQGDSASASRFYRSAAAAWPQDARLRERAVREAVEAGDLAGAAALARGIKADQRSDFAALVLMTDRLVANDLAGARAVAGPVIGGGLTVFSIRAMDQLAEARLSPASVDPVGPISRPDATPSDLEIAIRALRLDLAGRGPQAADAYAEARAGERSAYAPIVIREARALARLGRRADAAAALEAFRAQVPGHIGVRTELAALAAGAAAPALTVADASGVLIFAAAQAAMENRDFELGLRLLQVAIAFNPRDDMARIALGDVLSDLDRPAAAFAAFAAVPDGSPYADIARAAQVYVLIGRQQRDEALAMAAKLTAGPSPSQRALQAHADAYRSLERYQEAEAVYDRIVSAAGEAADWRLLYARGAMRERLKRWDDAETDLRLALLASGNDPEVANYLAYSWVERGENLKEAVTMLEQAVRDAPRSGHIVDSLGWALFKLGEFDRAIDQLERAAALLPGDPTINDHLGDAYWAADRKLEARFQWTRAAQLATEPGLKAAIERKLAERPVERPKPHLEAARGG
jgi:tetratricopeptide (TPR) repeat protein